MGTGRGRTLVARMEARRRASCATGGHGYSEALLLYLLALGSPTHPIPPSSYAALTASYRCEKLYGLELLHASPLFIHQLSHVWVDFRGHP